jgi:alkaline phosphatase D
MDFDGLESAVDLEELDETRGMGRRTFLMGALAVGAAASTPFNYAAAARKRRMPMAGEATFDTGVASGFPRPGQITLWTRLGEIKRTSKLKLIVATDSKFKNVVEEKLVTARRDRDFTVRANVKKLKPDKQYFYKFATKENGSPVGRFKTAPPLDSQTPIRIAFYSCQNWESGFFNAQRAIANEPDLDLVISLGDYIYEYSDIEAECGCGDVVRVDRTGGNKDGDVQLLPEYWEKYRLYKGDPDLRAMHAAHPFISVWDDHEVEDNHADGSPSSGQPDPNRTNLKNKLRRVPYLTRRANGYQAYFNYMPRIRFKGDRDRIYEHYRLGKLVDLLLTDERQYRDQQPCGDPILEACADAESPRTMLGDAQKQWFLRSLKGSGATWKLWGTELMVMATRLAPGLAAQVDAWDGYAYERKQILDYIVDNQIPNVVAITGDIHTFFAGTAYTTGDKGGTNPGRAAMPEFVGGSATSLGLPEATGLSDAVLTALAAVNPHIDFFDFRRRGYGLVEVHPNLLTCELKSVNALAPGNAATTTLCKYQVPLNVREPQRLV